MITRLESPHGEVRFGAALDWLSTQEPGRALLLVAHTLEAASALLRAATQAKGAVFGWSLDSLGSLAVRLSALPLASERLTLAPQLALEAVCVRVVSDLTAAGKLGRLTGIADRPGLPRALLRTFSDLGMAEVDLERLADETPEIAEAYRRYRATLSELKLADRAHMFQTALRAARESLPNLATPLCLYDLGLKTTLEGRLVRVLAERATDVLVTESVNDGWAKRALAGLGSALPLAPARPSAPPALRSLQAQLFSSAELPGEADESVSILSAPGESREAVEIVRRVLAEAARGVPFDRMAILLRSPFHYRTHLLEALRRAAVPAHFTRGALQPEPGGRALLVLLDCAAEGISATRFAEYLSLGVMPSPAESARVNPAGSLVLSDDEGSSLLRTRDAPAAPPDPSEVACPEPKARLVAPRRWESLLVDAAVIGGVERWRSRLSALERQLEHESQSPLEPQSQRASRKLEALRQLRAFALPLVEALAALPTSANWGQWLSALSALATHAVDSPAPVLAALSELQIVSEVGPVGLNEVRAVLKKRIGEVLPPSTMPPGGALLVASVDEARGRVFDVVFVPGLAEKLFPQRVVEDPLLLDEQRAKVSDELETQAARVANERQALSIAVGAARSRVVLSYPRFETDKARPRVPSFYALEAIRAAEGRLPGFAELTRRADEASQTRMGWPAPLSASAAIDASEYDLSVLHQFLTGKKRELDGAARYLISANTRLARALQFRARRWRKEWRNVDGLVEPSEPARAALNARRAALMRRGFAVTALERYSSCPYRFYLATVVGLSPREKAARVEELDPATRGTLIHQMLHDAGVELQRRDLLSGSHNERAALEVLESVVTRVADSWRENLAPAIDRVWKDAIEEIRVDLNRWLRELLHSDWQPKHFELAFGLPSGDAQAPPEPVLLDFGLPLRGAIDLVEQSGRQLRATDYKTGVAPAPGAVVGGGALLQPALYALVLEKLFPESGVVGGNAFYCSSRGDFRRNEVALNEESRAAAREVYRAIAQAFEDGFFPAAPAKDACESCDFRVNCGPYERERIARKEGARLEPLLKLRRLV